MSGNEAEEIRAKTQRTQRGVEADDVNLECVDKSVLWNEAICCAISSS